MSENIHNHEFTCRGPLTEEERDEFDAIALSFTESMAAAPTIDRRPGMPFYTEFVSTLTYDENGVGNHFEPVRLASFAAYTALQPEVARDLDTISELVIGVGNPDDLTHASSVLYEIGYQTNAPLQPAHEQLS
jgi:hypothetical protein